MRLATEERQRRKGPRIRLVGVDEPRTWKHPAEGTTLRLGEPQKMHPITVSIWSMEHGNREHARSVGGTSIVLTIFSVILALLMLGALAFG